MSETHYDILARHRNNKKFVKITQCENYGDATQLARELTEDFYKVQVVKVFIDIIAIYSKGSII